MLVNAHRIARSMGIPTVYTYHMPPELLTGPLPMRPLRPAINRQVRNFCNSCDLVIAPSKNLASQIGQDGIRAPIVHVSNPVDLSDASTAVVAPEKRGFTVLFAGRLAPEKNIPYLVKSFAAFARRSPDAELWLAGEGGERSRIENLARDLAVTDRVRFLGHLSAAALSKCYAAADAFVLPSLMETQGLVAMEAMRWGVPVLVSDQIVSARELVDDGSNGFLIDIGAEQDLVEKLALLSHDPGLCESMGRRGREKAAAYQPGHIVNQLVHHYRDVQGRAAEQPEQPAVAPHLVDPLGEGVLN